MCVKALKGSRGPPGKLGHPGAAGRSGLSGDAGRPGQGLNPLTLESRDSVYCFAFVKHFD